MIIAVDTNVIISGLIKPFSDASKILNLIFSGKIKIAYDARILSEYIEILNRKKFNFNSSKVESIIALIKDEGIYINSVPLKESLPDRDDTPFLEVAVAGKINFLITGNKKHFPQHLYENTAVLSPAEFIKECFLP